MLYDVGRRYPRAYVHRTKSRPREPGFNAEGKSEIVYIMNKVDELIDGRRSDEDSSFTVHNTQLGYVVNDTVDGHTKYTPRKIYQSPPHITADNHFSGDDVLDNGGKRGYGLTLTTRRDRFPKDLKQYLHHRKEKMTGDLAKRAKAMRYEKPIVGVCQVPENQEANEMAYTKTLTSFQSTGCTNISGVNNIKSLSLSVSQKKRGKGVQARVWGIEQNESRMTYLWTYFAIDNLDHMLKIAGIKMISWKYWHAPFLHAVSMAVVAAYDIYIECCEGELESDWYIPASERMDFRDFRLLLSKQMLQYNPTDNLIPGDDKFRVVTRQAKKKRSAPTPRFPSRAVNSANLKYAKTNGRICTTIDDLDDHFQSVYKSNNAAPCEVCGKNTKWRCGKCDDSPICVLKDRVFKGAQCLTALHNESYFGLTRHDKKHVHKQHLNQWEAPTTTEIRRNKRFIANINQAEADNSSV